MDSYSLSSMNTDDVIDELVDTCYRDRSSRERHLYRELLRNLVRLAKVENTLQGASVMPRLPLLLGKLLDDDILH